MGVRKYLFEPPMLMCFAVLQTIISQLLSMTTLRKIRLSKGVSQTWMAQQLGIHRMTYVNYETGKTRIPRSVLFHSAHLLNVTAYELEADI